MKTIWIKHLIDDEDWQAWKRYYKESEIRQSLYDVGETGMNDCYQNAVEHNHPERKQ